MKTIPVVSIPDGLHILRLVADLDGTCSIAVPTDGNEFHKVLVQIIYTSQQQEDWRNGEVVCMVLDGMTGRRLHQYIGFEVYPAFLLIDAFDASKEGRFFCFECDGHDIRFRLIGQGKSGPIPLEDVSVRLADLPLPIPKSI